MPDRRHDAGDYTVGWVCALPLEMAAAKGMLDEIHPNLSEQASGDHNSYILGQVAGHNVVIACLPVGIYGTTSAATVAKDMLRTFKSIRFGLMVGIGGGAPSSGHDIRLGDIVVSQPSGTTGGVIQYDRGKDGRDGFERAGSLNTPPQVLLTALGRLQADHLAGDCRVPDFLSDLFDKRPSMKKAFGFQGESNDFLFQAEYEHAGGDPECEQCDRTRAVQRDARDDTDPVVHYGNIASGNLVIKNARTRDRLRKDLGVLCFEMEAAGLMQDFPCMVIRGICDYADSHKNKAWQGYAAAVAAAFAKELLQQIPPSNVQAEKPITQVVSDTVLHGLVSNTNEAITHQTRKQDIRYENEKQVECHRVFKTSQYEEFKDINADRVEGTCKWVLAHPQYRKWCQSLHDDLLWISADPGCGKSVLAKSLIDKELRGRSDHTVCYFFFKDSEAQDSIATALCAVLHQLFGSKPILLRHAIPAYERNGAKVQDEVDELWRIFLAAAMDQSAGAVTCVFDALDECQSNGRRKLIRLLTDFYARNGSSTARRCQVKFLVTSRPYRNIESSFGNIPFELPSIRLAGEESNTDISKEINLVIREKVNQAGDKLHPDQDVRNALVARLLEIPHRTYLWLHLVWEELNSSTKRTKKAFFNKIETLPLTVEAAYEEILEKHSRGQRAEVEALLRIVVGSRRPLTLEEMDVAFQLATESPNAVRHDHLDLDGDDLKMRIRELCGLFVFINDNRIYLIHQTAKEFLVAKGNVLDPAGNQWKQSLHPQIFNRIMAQICVQYLSFTDIRNERMCSEAGKADITLKNFPLLEYSSVNWPAHAKEMDGADETLFASIFNLYDANAEIFEIWVSIFLKAAYPYASRDGIRRAHLAALHGRVEGRTALLWAALGGHGDVVQLLLDKGAGVNAQCGVYGNALQAASSQGHSDIVKLLLGKGGDVNAHGGYYGNPLYAASFRGHAEIVELLLEKEANVNAHGGVYGNALKAASYEGHAMIAKLLLKKGADVNAHAGKYVNALYAASYRGHKEIVNLLLENGAEIDAQGGYYSNPLIVASFGGHVDIVKLLLEKSADDNMQGGVYDNALYTASSEGHAEIVKLLLKKGADVNAQGSVYDDALYTASSDGHAENVKLLVKKGTDINACSDEDNNALYAASSRGHTETVKLLLEKGADVNAQGGYYGYALYAALLRGHAEIVKLLLEKEADDNAQGTVYGNALYVASSGGHAEIVKHLLEKSADDNMQGGVYDNALYTASSEGHAEIVKLLLDKGGDNNAQCGVYGNALQAASSKGHGEIVKLLLVRGADVNAQGGYYCNALYAASFRGHTETVKLLLEREANVKAQGGAYGNALQAASSQGHGDIVKLLLEKSADDNMQGGVYDNALFTASFGGHFEIVKLLLKRGGADNAEGGMYSSALQAASSQGHSEIVKLLSVKGADINAQGGGNGHKPLSWAVENGSELPIRLLLGIGNADVNAGNVSGRTALSWTAENGHEAVLKLLLDTHDIKAGKADTNGRTPLLWATERGHFEVDKMLVGLGNVNTAVDDACELTAMQLATLDYHDEVEGFLLANNAPTMDGFYGLQTLYREATACSGQS